MDIFLEKIVKRKRTFIDLAIGIGSVILAIVLIMILGAFRFLQVFAPLYIVGLGYLAYVFIRNRNIEYEYIVTNGDIDIDKIVAQRKRKRVFSANCKEFEMVAKMTSGKYDHNMQNIKKQLMVASSMDSKDLYFISLVKNGEKMIVFFEPHTKMIESFKKYIPTKVFE